jgi:hypothetical protein
MSDFDIDMDEEIPIPMKALAAIETMLELVQWGVLENELKEANRKEDLKALRIASKTLNNWMDYNVSAKALGQAMTKLWVTKKQWAKLLAMKKEEV